MCRAGAAASQRHQRRWMACGGDGLRRPGDAHTHSKGGHLEQSRRGSQRPRPGHRPAVGPGPAAGG